MKAKELMYKIVTKPDQVKYDLELSSGFQKYPARRDAEIKDAFTWMQGKRESDGVWPYWRVHDKLYDLTEFLSRHPGGKFWLEQTQGSDITENFVSCHNSEAPHKILKKYYVKDADTPRNSPFTFKENGFYMTLKRKAIPILKKAGTGPTLQMYFIQDSLTFTFLMFLLCGGWMQSKLLLVLAGVFLALAILASHNFAHQKENWRMYLWDAGYLSSNEWKITHMISHHVFPNTIYDFEIEIYEPWLLFLPMRNKPFYMWNRGFFKFAAHVMMPGMFFFIGLFEFIRLLFSKKRQNISIILPLIQVLYIIMVSSTLLQGLLHSWIFHLATVYTQQMVSITMSHHHPSVYKDGDKLPKNRDWGLLQIYATRERNCVMKSLFLTAISFGNHTLHHLFPTVDHSKLPLLIDPFMETCKEFGIEPNFITPWEFIKGTYASLSKETTNPNLPDVITRSFKDDPNPTKSNQPLKNVDGSKDLQTGISARENNSVIHSRS